MDKTGIDKLFNNVSEQIESVLRDEGFGFLISLKRCECELEKQYSQKKNKSHRVELRVIRNAKSLVQEITRKWKRCETKKKERIRIKCSIRLEEYIQRMISRQYQLFLQHKVTKKLACKYKCEGYARALTKLMKIYKNM